METGKAENPGKGKGKEVRKEIKRLTLSGNLQTKGTESRNWGTAMPKLRYKKEEKF